ncbi:LOW QUALITY PROTEIN: protein CIP2A [Aplochiton taeniatus]
MPLKQTWHSCISPVNRMDLTTCLKSLHLVIHKYRDNKSSQNKAQLQKQIEDVAGLRWGRLLSSGQVLPSECVSGLVEVAGDPNTSPALTGTIISLLAQLACDDETREVLHSSYNLTATLASIIHWQSATPGEPLVLQCLQLLQKLTYNTRVFHGTNSVHELLTFLMTNIQSPNDDIIMPCLGLLANLCRYSQSVQSHVKALVTLCMSVELLCSVKVSSHDTLQPSDIVSCLHGFLQGDVKAFYRTLIDFLAHDSLTVVVFALSILASLALNEKVGEKLFDAKNIHKTFQLVFNIIVNGDGPLTRKCSVDLLVDLLKNPKIANYLTRYEHFSACVSQVMCLLHAKDPDSATKVLELLLALCRESGLRSLLCEVVFRPTGPRLRAACRRQVPGLLDSSPKAEPALALVQWLSLPMEGAEACSLQTLQLFTELLEEALAAECVLGRVLSFVEVLLPVVLELLQSLDSQGDAPLQTHCLRNSHFLWYTWLKSLTPPLLCGEDSARSVVSRQLSAQLCLSRVERLLSCCHGSDPFTGPPSGSENDIGHVCAAAILKTLELMSKLRHQVTDMETSFYKILQDQRMVTPFSLALSSNQGERVQAGLRLLCEATPLPVFPLLVLGESIAANNAYRQREAELSVKRVAVQEVPPHLEKPLSPPPSPSKRNINRLVENLQTSMEVCDQVKDVPVSEIMDIYEQKISALASKESRLQDLLDTKALALSQADRLLSQYRCQRAQAEAEARKLAGLLKEATRRGEQLQGELGSQVLEVERSRADMEELLCHNSRLQQDSQEHQALKGAYNQLLNRFSESERLLKELQASHITLTKHSDTLRKSRDALQLQHEKTVSELEEREALVTALQSELQHRDGDIREPVAPLELTSPCLPGLRAEVRAHEERGRESEAEKRELEETVERLRRELNKTEQARKDATIRASSLELQKSQVEAKLQKKEDELDKHSAMIAMIHSLSSGKVKSDVNLSL